MAPTHASLAHAPLDEAQASPAIHHERLPRAPIQWEADEYAHADKSNDWYWALGLVAISGTVAALIFNNILFAVIILLGSFSLAIFAARKPERVTFAVTQRGVRIADKLYPYQTLKSFNVEELSTKHTPKLLIDSKKFFTPLMVIPIEGVDADHVHDYLLDFLPEEDHMEPFAHRLMEWLGF